ncbi:MAG: thiamine phosphate synthase, partial [Caldiserica bacterium]
VDIALGCSADGVHIGPDDIDYQLARKILGKNKIIGVSTHSFNEVKQVIELKPDYFSIGPIFKTTTKLDHPPLGPEIIRKIKVLKTKIPFLAIGGINEKNIDVLKKYGVERVALTSAIINSKNPEKVVKYLKGGLNENS